MKEYPVNFWEYKIYSFRFEASMCVYTYVNPRALRRG